MTTDAGNSMGYPVIFPLGASASSIKEIPAIDGGTCYPTGTTTALCSAAPCTSARTALSISDFNIFKGNVKSSLDILDQKIRDLEKELTTKT